MIDKKKMTQQITNLTSIIETWRLEEKMLVADRHSKCHTPFQQDPTDHTLLSVIVSCELVQVTSVM